jgi:cell shape-determining protein MreD
MNGRIGWGYWAFIALLVVLHFLLRVGLGYEQLAPDLLVVALLLAARNLAAGYAAGVGLVLGILDGALVPFALGASALALTVLGFAGARSRELFSDDNYLLLALYLFVGKWAFDTILFFATGDVFRAGGSYLLLVSPLTALYAAAAGLLSITVYKAFA